MQHGHRLVDVGPEPVDRPAGGEQFDHRRPQLLPTRLHPLDLAGFHRTQRGLGAKPGRRHPRPRGGGEDPRVFLVVETQIDPVHPARPLVAAITATLVRQLLVYRRCCRLVAVLIHAATLTGHRYRTSKRQRYHASTHPPATTVAASWPTDPDRAGRDPAASRYILPELLPVIINIDVQQWISGPSEGGRVLLMWPEAWPGCPGYWPEGSAMSGGGGIVGWFSSTQRTTDLPCHSSARRWSLSADLIQPANSSMIHRIRPRQTWRIRDLNIQPYMVNSSSAAHRSPPLTRTGQSVGPGWCPVLRCVAEVPLHVTQSFDAAGAAQVNGHARAPRSVSGVICLIASTAGRFRAGGQACIRPILCMT